MNEEQLKDIAIGKFFDFYKSDVEAESIDVNNVVLSFPVHFSGFHRVEITVTRVTPNQFIISDGAKTLEELRNAGYAVNSRLRKRLQMISRAANIRVVNDHLVSNSDSDQLGSAIQRFLEAAKTIGDAYLVQRASPPRDTNLLNRVSEFLVEQQVPFRIKHQLEGEFERHVVDFYFPPNGVPGLALSVMGNPTKMATEAWAFKSSDIKKVNERTQIGVIYEDEAGDPSKAILSGIADVAVSSANIPALQDSLMSIGILKGA